MGRKIYTISMTPGAMSLTRSSLSVTSFSSRSANPNFLSVPVAQRRSTRPSSRHEVVSRATGTSAKPTTAVPAPMTVSHMDNGSWVRTDGNILIPGNFQDFKIWALDPAMSADDQILILAVACILSAQGKKTLGIPEKVSAGFWGFAKVLSVLWVALYWCEGCKDVILGV